MKWFARLIPVFSLVILLTPFVVSAEQIVACTGVADPSNPNAIRCGTCEFVATIKNIYKFLLSLATIFITGMFVYVGLKMAVSGGNPSAMQQAKELFINTCIGLFFVLGGFAIVDAIVRGIVPEGSAIRNWQTITCIYAKDPSYNPVQATSRDDIYNGAGQHLPAVSGIDLCNNEYLGKYFPGEERVAQCVLKGESTCGASFYSTTDVVRQADGSRVPFSVSPWQINLTVHEIRAGECKTGPIDCKAAFTGKNFNAQLTNYSIYTSCIEALKDPDCSGAIAKRIRKAGWTQWSAYTANKCRI